MAAALQAHGGTLMGCGAQLVGRLAERDAAPHRGAAPGARLGIVRQQNPNGCVRPGHTGSAPIAGRSALLSGLGWIALALLATGLVMLAVA